jgi:hypothetical protein
MGAELCVLSANSVQIGYNRQSILESRIGQYFIRHEGYAVTLIRNLDN